MVPDEKLPKPPSVEDSDITSTAGSPPPLPVKPKRKYTKRAKPNTSKTKTLSTVNVMLTGKYPGVHATNPSIRFTPDVIAQVPEDAWIKAQIKAKYLKRV